MDHASLLRTLRQPLHDIDPDELRQALIGHRVCAPPEPAGGSVNEWLDQWPADALEAVGRFLDVG